MIISLTKDLEESKEKIKDSKHCLICLSEQINCVIKPCNHACVCDKCILKIEDCPMDRKKIISFDKIFL